MARNRKVQNGFISTKEVKSFLRPRKTEVPEFTILNPEEIVVEDWVKRKYSDEGFLERLGEDIELRGLMEEPVVERLNGRPYLRCGYHRYLVHLKANKPLRCRVRRFASDFERWEFHVKENTMRIELSDLEKGKEAVYGIEVLKRPREVVAKVLGVSKSVVDKLILIEKELPEDVKRILRHRKYTQIYELLKLKDDYKKLLALAEWVARTDPSPHEIREKVSEVLSQLTVSTERRGSKYAQCYICGGSVEKEMAERIYLHTKCYEKLDKLKEKLGKEA